VSLEVASVTRTAPAGPIQAGELRAGLAAAADWLERHREAIDALNVFPVPDGDTGLNMSLTLRAAADEAAAADGKLDAVAAAMARGALMGARGNSGVILAEWLRGVARALEGEEAVDAGLFARALSAGADAAYSAVAHPVEGTILTVARRAADAAHDAAGRSASLTEMLRRTHDAARAAVAETPELLPILKQASVVDSGGEGLRVLLEGLLLHLEGRPVGGDSAPVGMRVDFASLHAEANDTSGYCTEVLFSGEDLRPDAIRARLADLGSSVLAVGDSELMKVHVHTTRPGSVLEMATELGEIVAVKVDNLGQQRREFEAAVAKPAPVSSDPGRALEPGTSIVAVALGAGFQSIFESHGATVVRVERTMNPSVQEFLDAIRKTATTDVVVLPNDPNAAPAARQAAKRTTERTVEVVQSQSMPCGIAALLAASPEAAARTNASAMTEAAGRCHWIEVTRAVRSARLGDLDVDKGALFTTVDSAPVATSDTYPALIEATLPRLQNGSATIATVYVGKDGDQTVAQEIAEIIRSHLGILVEIMAGGQPHHAYIISVE
jgi:uncharacterized protein